MQEANSSSSASPPSPHLCFSNSSVYPHFFKCFDDPLSSVLFMAFNIVNILLFLPLYILVLWKGFQRWQHQFSETAGSGNPSDVFIYHTVMVEIIGVLGAVFYLFSIGLCNPKTLIVGFYSVTIMYPGQTSFHCLACVERYLAVVHPITYMGLRKSGGMKVRNISIGCVWLITFGMTGITALIFPDFPSTMFIAFLAFSIVVIYFCSLSVFSALIRLGLGKVGGDRRQTDQPKRKAFQTIVVIMIALMFRLSGLLIFNVINDLAPAEIGRAECVLFVCCNCLCLPSSLALPLLFLYKAGTLACFRLK